MRKWLWTAAAMTIVLTGCQASETTTEADDGNMALPANDIMPGEIRNEAAPMRAVATLQTAEGVPAGTASATAGDTGIVISITARGLPPGQHGAHIHMTGQCEPPSFESAGNHWNPGDAQHGLENPQGPHAGDMPNLVVNEDGLGTLEYTLQGGSFEDLLDADGSAMVIHASADDQMTEPSGNSGARIACGVFEAS